MASPKKNKDVSPRRPLPSKKNNASAEIAPKDKSDNSRLLLFASALVLAFLTFFVYQGALDNEFVDWDDYAYVIENNLVRSDVDMEAFIAAKNARTKITSDQVTPYTTTNSDVFRRIVSLNYHPLTVLTMRWNNNACPDCYEGISAKPFIQWNLILHILNSILLLLIIYWMSKKNLYASIIVALIFALHPMHVESVAWVSERKDVLYTFFFLGALLSYTKYLDKKQVKWLGIAFVLFILACLSKAMAVVLPLVMLLMWFWNDKSEDNIASVKKTLSPANFLHTIPFFGVALLFGLIAANVQGGGDFNGFFEKSSSAVAINSFDTFSILQRLQFACYGLLQYIIKFFVPTGMCTFYPYPDQVTYDASLFFKVAPVLVAAIIGLTLYSLKFTKSIAVGIGFYVVTVILVLQFVSVGAVIMADRYTYLPYIGLAFILVMLAQEFVPKKTQLSVYGVMTVFVLFLIPITQAQIETWQDSEALWTNVIDLHKINDNVIPQNLEQPLSIRGNFYGKKSEKVKTPEEAKAYIEKAFKDFELAAKLGSKRPDVYEGIGNTYGMQANYPKALENFSKAIQLDPTKGSVYFNRGVTYSIMKEPQKAIEDYSNALKFAPEQAPLVHVNRGLSYMELGQKEAAIEDFKNALKYNPNNQQAQQYLKQLTQ